jgi:iron complex outermembrane receptor protein
MTNVRQRKSKSGKSHAQSPNKIYVMTPLAAAIVAALSPTIPAFAQEDAARIDEIIVTATKREISLQDVPHSIDVLSSVELERIGAKSLDDVIKALPSISLASDIPGRNSLVIRGISQELFEYRTDAQVAVYLDEQPMTTSSQQVGIRAIDMERIESLAGPQGTLFGSSSQTGTIRYITNKPNFRGVSGRVEGRYGSTEGGEDSYDFSAHINIPVVDDKFALRVVGYTSHDGGWVDNVLGSSLSGNFDNAAVAGDDQNEYDVDGGRIAALWNMSDKWSLLASLVTEQTHAEGSWETDPFLGDHKITRFITEDREDDWYSSALSLEGDLGFAQLSMTATHFDRDITYNWDNNSYNHFKDRTYGGGLYWEQYYAGNPYYYDYSYLPLYNSEYILSTIFNDQQQERDSIEIRLTSSGESKLQWTVGGFYEDVYDEWYYGTVQPGIEDTVMWAYADYLAWYYGVDSNYYNNYTPNTNISYPLPLTDVSYSDTLKRSVEQIAVFGEVSYDLTDKLTLLAGMRWAEYDRDSYSRVMFPEGLPAGDRGTGDGSFASIGKTDDTIYKASLRYNIDDDRMIYALYSEGFRLGGINSPRAAATGKVPFEYQPDYLDNYEFGIKSQWLDGRLTINADVFLMEWSDYQTGADFDQWWLVGTVNAKAAETQGFEVQADWQATDRLLLSGNLFIADPQFSEDWSNNFEDGEQQGPIPGDLNISKGMPMPGSPERKYFVSAYYEVPDVLGGDLWFYLDHSYVSERWSSTWQIVNNNTNAIAPSSTYSSMKLGLRLQNELEFDLHVRNLFDEKGYGYVSTGSNDDADLFDDPRYHNLRAMSQPRTVWLSVRKDFGGG